MSLRELLRQPFPYDPCIRNRLGIAVFFGAFVFGFLMLFKPFNLDQFPPKQLLFIAFVYGMVTFSCVFVANSIFPLVFPQSFNESTWTAGKQILFTAGVIFLVGLVNYLVSPILVGSTLNLYNAFWFQGITLAIGLFPVSFFILLRQNMLLKRFSQQAGVIEKKLQEKTNSNAISKETITSNPNKITFLGDYNNEKVEVYIDDLYFVTSASNYIKLFHLQQEKLVYSIIRSTLKKTEEKVLQYPNFFKCHRAYIINLDKIYHVEGNAQGYKVRVKGYDELIPVSRNVHSEFSDKLLAFRQLS